MIYIKAEANRYGEMWIRLACDNCPWMHDLIYEEAEMEIDLRSVNDTAAAHVCPVSTP